MDLWLAGDYASIYKLLPGDLRKRTSEAAWVAESRRHVARSGSPVSYAIRDVQNETPDVAGVRLFPDLCWAVRVSVKYRKTLGEVKLAYLYRDGALTLLGFEQP